jgi:hypothetical protein
LQLAGVVPAALRPFGVPAVGDRVPVRLRPELVDILDGEEVASAISPFDLEGYGM